MAPITERPDMGGYGVPDSTDGLLPWSWAEQRLVTTRNYWLATASVDGRPHVMPVWGQWLIDPDRFVFSCAPTARKARNIEANARVSVAADDSVEVVVIEGTASLLEGDDKQVAAAGFGPKYETDPAAADALVQFYLDHTMFEVVPEVGFGIIEREEEFQHAATRWRWA